MCSYSFVLHVVMLWIVIVLKNPLTLVSYVQCERDEKDVIYPKQVEGDAVDLFEVM